MTICRWIFRFVLLGLVGYAVCCIYRDDRNVSHFNYLQLKSHYEEHFDKITVGEKIYSEKGTGLSYRQLMASSTTTFPNMVKTTLNNGQDLYIGESVDGYSEVSIWGTRQEVIKARLMTYVPTLKSNYDLHGTNKFLLDFFLACATKLDVDARNWADEVIKKSFRGETTREQKVFKNVRVTIEYNPVVHVFFAHIIAADAVDPNIGKKLAKKKPTVRYLIRSSSPIWIYFIVVACLYFTIRTISRVEFIGEIFKYSRIMYILGPPLLLFFLINASILGWDTFQYIRGHNDARLALYESGREMYIMDMNYCIYVTTACSFAAFIFLPWAISWLEPLDKRYIPKEGDTYMTTKTVYTESETGISDDYEFVPIERVFTDGSWKDLKSGHQHASILKKAGDIKGAEELLIPICSEPDHNIKACRELFLIWRSYNRVDLQYKNYQKVIDRVLEMIEIDENDQLKVTDARALLKAAKALDDTDCIEQASELIDEFKKK